MELDDLIFTGNEKEQKTMKRILKEHIPLETISLGSLDPELKNEFYASMYLVDHGAGVKVVPRYELDSIRIDTEKLRDVKYPPETNIGGKKVERGYIIDIQRDEFFEIEDPSHIIQLRIYYK